MRSAIVKKPRKQTKLTVETLDDRTMPSSALPDSILVPPTWHESKFSPYFVEPTSDGGSWVAGTTQAAGNYNWYGSWNNSWGIAKLNASGNLDPSFNNGNVKDLSTGVLDWFRLLDIQTGPDGKLYALARNTFRDRIFENTATDSNSAFPYVPLPIPAPPEGFAVIRLNADGTLDTTFSADGIALIDLDIRANNFSYYSSTEAKFAIGADGKIVVAGSQYNYSGTEPKLSLDILRLKSDGSLDTSFDTDGRAVAVVPFGNQSDSYVNGYLAGIGIGANGAITLGGNISYSNPNGNLPPNDTENAVFALRLKANGALDTTLDADGLAIISTSTFDPNHTVNVSELEVTSTNEVYFVGSLYANYYYPAISPPNFIPEPGQAFVLKLNTAGALDSNFAGDGVLEVRFAPHLNVTSGTQITLLANGSLAFAGVETPLQTDPNIFVVSNYVVAKFKANGDQDPTFQTLRQTPANNSTILDFDELSDGRMLAVSGYPSAVFTIDVDGSRASTVTIPYNRQAPWQPPLDWVPFPILNSVYSSTQADFDGDGVLDWAFATGAGSISGVRVVSGSTGIDLIANYQPYENQFRGGMFVAAADFNSDGKAELIVSPNEGGSARIQIFEVTNSVMYQKANFFAIEDPNFRGGGAISVSDVNNDGVDDLIVGAAKGGAQRIATFDGKNVFRQSQLPPVLFGDYFAPLPGIDPKSFREGVNLATYDFNGDGKNDTIITPAGGGEGIVILGHSATQPKLRFQYSNSSTTGLWELNLLNGEVTQGE